MSLLEFSLRLFRNSSPPWQKRSRLQTSRYFFRHHLSMMSITTLWTERFQRLGVSCSLFRVECEATIATAFGATTLHRWQNCLSFLLVGLSPLRVVCVVLLWKINWWTLFKLLAIRTDNFIVANCCPAGWPMCPDWAAREFCADGCIYMVIVLINCNS